MPTVDPPADERRERIARIKRQIADGTYETPEKLEAAIDAFLDDAHPNPPEA